jgi:cation:H+ antiporter
MLLELLLFCVGLLLLYGGAEALILGSSRLAVGLGLRPLVVGMTVVALATSMPEFLVSVLAATQGSNDLAVGNIVGSNIANIGLILGFAALLRPLPVASLILRRELPIMLAAALLLVGLCLDGRLGFGDGLLLFLLLPVFLGFCLLTAREPAGEGAGGGGKTGSRELLLILAGIGGLGSGAELLVHSASALARALGVSELVIGLSVLALGTSLPELAASLVGALKGEMEISVGNVIGSNIFNILFVLGVCPMIRPLTIDPVLLHRELPVMLLFCLALPLLLGKRLLDRRRGGLLLGGYLLFLATLFL